jgi:hypothetical protein
VGASASFSGRWSIDRPRSDGLGEMLRLMGVPWVARKIAESLEVVSAVTDHRPRGELRLTVEDRSSLGNSSSSYVLDGKPRAVTGKDGKTATLTCVSLEQEAARTAFEAAFGGDALSQHVLCGAVRVFTLLPDALGESTDTRFLLAPKPPGATGRQMRQLLYYARGSGKGEQVTLRRVMKELPPDAATEPSQEPPSAVAAAAEVTEAVAAVTLDGTATTASVERSVATAPAPAPTSGAPPATCAAATASVSTASGASPAAAYMDPFFVSLTGSWGSDSAHPEAAASAAGMDKFWKSVGAGWISRLIVGSVDITTHLTHCRDSFVVEDSSALGRHAQSIPLWRPRADPARSGSVPDGPGPLDGWVPLKQIDGKHMLMRSFQESGAGDRGPTWLGSLGSVPAHWLGDDSASDDENDEEKDENKKEEKEKGATESKDSLVAHAPAVASAERESEVRPPVSYPRPGAAAPAADLSEDLLDADGSFEDAVGDEGYPDEEPGAGTSNGDSARDPAESAAPSAAPADGSETTGLLSDHNHFTRNAPYKPSKRGGFERLLTQREAGREERLAASLAPQVRPLHVRLANVPVHVTDFTECVVTTETRLVDISDKRRHFPSTVDTAPPAVPKGSTLRVRYVLRYRTHLTVQYEHINAVGAVVCRAQKHLVRRETPDQRIVFEKAEAARLEHACILVSARRARADQLRQDYLRRRTARLLPPEKPAQSNAALTGQSSDAYPEDTHNQELLGSSYTAPSSGASAEASDASCIIM